MGYELGQRNRTRPQSRKVIIRHLEALAERLSTEDFSSLSEDRALAGALKILKGEETEQ